MQRTVAPGALPDGSSLFSEAEDAARRALTLRPADPRALHNLCDLHREWAKWDAQDDHPDTARYHLEQSMLAAQTLERAAPGWESGTYLLGQAYADLMTLADFCGDHAAAAQWKVRATGILTTADTAVSERIATLRSAVNAFTGFVPGDRWHTLDRT